LFHHLYTVAQAAQLWGCLEEIIQTLVENGTIPTHRAYLGMFGPVRLDGDYVDLVAPDARMLNKHFDEMMGGLGWQERKKQEREQIEQKIEQIKTHTEEIRQESERQQQAFHQQLSEITDRHAQRLYQQIFENTERYIQEIKKNDNYK
jgi:plasmid stabilization system protein ParE